MADEDIYLSNVLTVGKVYLLTYTIDTLSGGSVTPILGASLGIARTTTGSFAEYFTADGATFGFRIDEAYTALISAWSCVEFDTTPDSAKAMLDWSDDGGHNWSNEHWRNMGKTGEYAKRVRWNRLGSSRDRIFRIKISDPIKKVIIAGHLDFEIGNS